ncbi:chemotaxis protein [Bradyrhizobium neotropicale]|uniref:chemotaxis protein n=1 Tax=Bradyrhizobium neotropicale TaxID=1497615 RepID=UPI001AD68AEC|nr:chemotaxis protein [Bradyrhizobium neotropicale]MBO4223984.1 chemotaxis protein [Bradyrhizobium neotropicale]
MNRVGTIAVALVVLVGAARAEEAEAPSREPYQMIRALHALQDDIARGSLEAHNAQPALLKRLGEEFQKVDPSVWKEPRNSRAVVTFLLSGGSPQVVDGLRSRKLLVLDEAILDGAIAYVEGRAEDAKARLGSMHARDLPPTIAAEIALVQSALVAQTDPKAAIERLDDARLLMPGTLVEEAALRREIFVAGQVDDFDKFEALAQRYFRRFRHSIYAGNFRQRLAVAVARFSFVQQSDRFPRLVALLDQLDDAGQRALYLLIARTALVRGKVEMADLAAERVLGLTDEGSSERERARFYRAAARVVTNAHDQALLDLQKIEVGRLPERDAELLKAALAVGRNVKKALPAAPAQQDQPGEAQTSMRPRIDFGRSLAAVNRAQVLLDESKEQLKERAR